MASPAERMTMDYPVDLTGTPSTDRTVKGVAQKVSAADVAAMRKKIGPG
jgi:hypothetical protein